MGQFISQKAPILGVSLKDASLRGKGVMGERERGVEGHEETSKSQ